LAYTPDFGLTQLIRAVPVKQLIQPPVNLKNGLKLSTGVIAIGLAALGQARAAMITFDDLPDSFPGDPTPNGYGGLDWDHLYVLDGSNINTFYGISASGYANGVVSPNKIAFNYYGSMAITTSASAFNLVSGYFTAAFNNNLSLEVKGYNGTTLLYDQIYTLNPYSPINMALNMNNITEADFNSSGGYNAGLNYG
jgi:hypothetical protein